METDIVIAVEAEGDFDRFRRGVVLFGLAWLGLAVLAVYVDYKIQMRRARKRREEGEHEPPTEG